MKTKNSQADLDHMPVCEQPSCSQMEETRGFRMPDQTAGLPKEVG